MESIYHECELDNECFYYLHKGSQMLNVLPECLGGLH